MKELVLVFFGVGGGGGGDGRKNVKLDGLSVQPWEGREGETEI